MTVISKLNFAKNDGLVPAIVQDAESNKVLMLGYMNQEAVEITLQKKQVTFYSRSKQRIWTKGETSGNFLKLKELISDCDSDTILIKAVPTGPVCHLGTDTCFGESNVPSFSLESLQAIIYDRKRNTPQGSYTTELFSKGINAIAQKVGEEAVELIIEAKDQNDSRLKEEAADLLFHFLVLLSSRNIDLSEIVATLDSRHS